MKLFNNVNVRECDCSLEADKQKLLDVVEKGIENNKSQDKL